MENFSRIGQNVSILDRLMKMYYDHGLAEYEIGWGQQFYIEYLYDHPGASAQEMVECIRVDKATVTKIVKKLTQIEYIRIIPDKNDKRIKRLYLTELAIPAAKRIKSIHQSFYETICQGLTNEEIEFTEQILMKMVDNINQKVWHRMDNH